MSKNSLRLLTTLRLCSTTLRNRIVFGAHPTHMGMDGRGTATDQTGNRAAPRRAAYALFEGRKAALGP